MPQAAKNSVAVRRRGRKMTRKARPRPLLPSTWEIVRLLPRRRGRNPEIAHKVG